MANFDAGAVYARLKFDDSEFQQSTQNTQSTIEKIGESAKKILAKGFELASKGLQESVKAANEFNKEFSNVTTLVDPALVDINKMRSDLLGLDNRLGSATELTEGLYQAISASVDPAKAVEFVGEAAKFATAALTSTDKAVDVITTSLNAYGLEADQAGKVSDVLFATIKKGKTTGDQLARSIGKSIPLAANAGVEFEELGATIAILTRQGNSTSEATTQINSTISSLIKPSEAAKEALSDFGYESAQAAIEQEGLVGTIKGMIEQTDGSQESIAKLFPNIRALRGALALTGEGAKDFDEVLAEIKNSAGATGEAFGKQEITFETFGNAVNKLAITLGNELLPFVYLVTDFITDFVEEITSAGTLSNVLGEAVSFVAGTFNLLTNALGPVVNDLLLSAQEEFDSVADMIAGTGDETTNALVPFQIFAKVLGVLSGVANSLIKGFGALARTIVNVVKVANAAGNILDEIGKFITFQESDIGGAFEALGGNIDTLVGDVVDGVQEVGTAAFDTISKLMSDTTDDALKYQKLFNDGIDNNKNKLDAYTVAGRTATDTTHELSVNFEGLAGQAGQASDQVAGLSDSVNTYNDSLQGAVQSEIWYQNEAVKTAQAIAAQEEAFKSMFASLQEIGLSSLSNINDALLETGQAFGSGADGAMSFANSMGNVATEILKSLPALLLQAGLALLPTNLPVGLGLIAASAVASFGVGAIVGALGIDAAADGGPQHGLTLVGEQGPELVNFGSPSMVVPNNETQSMLGGQMNFYFTGPINSDIDLQKAAVYFGRQMQAERTRIR